jgi:hypothetical protein
MSIEKNDPTEESVETTETVTGELSTDEAETAAGGLKRVWDGGEGGHHEHGGDGRDGGDGKPGLKYV